MVVAIITRSVTTIHAIIIRGINHMVYIQIDLSGYVTYAVTTRLNYRVI